MIGVERVKSCFHQFFYGSILGGLCGRQVVVLRDIAPQDYAAFGTSLLHTVELIATLYAAKMVWPKVEQPSRLMALRAGALLGVCVAYSQQTIDWGVLIRASILGCYAPEFSQL